MSFAKIILTLIIVTLAGCGKTENETADKIKSQVESDNNLLAPKSSAGLSSRTAAPVSKMKNLATPTGTGSTAKKKNSYTPADIKSPNISKKRLIIKNGELTIEIEKYDKAVSQLTKIADSLGGYISDAQMNIHYTGVREGRLEIRIPAEKFETAMDLIKKTAVKIERENTKASDVTEEFYDLEARLSNKKKAELRMQEILRTAKTVSEILSVEESLTDIREDIERFEGRLRYLSDQTAVSTIKITLHEKYPLEVSRSGGFWRTIGDGFVDGFKGFAVVLRGTITFLIAGIPIFALFFLIVFLIIKIVKRAKKK